LEAVSLQRLIIEEGARAAPPRARITKRNSEAKEAAAAANHNAKGKED